MNISVKVCAVVGRMKDKCRTRTRNENLKCHLLLRGGLSIKNKLTKKPTNQTNNRKNLIMKTRN